MRSQVGIIGAGPAGLFLAHLLQQVGIESVILERRSRDYLERRVRAGVLEQGTIDTMQALGLDARLRREGLRDEGLALRYHGGTIQLDLPGLTGGKSVMIYGQQEVVKDLIAARLDGGQPIHFDTEVISLDGLDGDKPGIRYRDARGEHVLHCDYVAGCDGYHGPCRAAVPAHAITVHDHAYDFAWLGVLARARPLADMTYSNSDRGFALCSRRSNEVSRLYLQVPSGEDPATWSDDRFWQELHTRMFDQDRTEVVEGEIFQRDVAQLRAFVATPMQYGRLFLAGDAVHIVPPTGAKGLNLAVADARVLAGALTARYRNGRTDLLAAYSDTCLRRVWKTIRFSTWMTGLLHRIPSHTPFERDIQLSELAYIQGSHNAQAVIAEQYVGLPLAA